MIQDHLSFDIADCYEKIHTDVNYEICVDDALEDEVNSLRGGLEAKAIRSEENLVDDEDNTFVFSNSELE